MGSNHSRLCVVDEAMRSLPEDRRATRSMLTAVRTGTFASTEEQRIYDHVFAVGSWKGINVLAVALFSRLVRMDYGLPRVESTLRPSEAYGR